MSQHVPELVDLPDPAVRPLVHPLDLPEARRLIRASALVGALAGPSAGLGIAALVWFASRSWLVPLIAGAVVIVFGDLARRHLAEQAWAFIPRRRQDRARPLPVSWQLGQTLAIAALWSAAVLLLAARLARPDVPAQVAEVTFGMGAATGLLLAVDLLHHAVSRDRSARAHLAVAGAGIAAVVVATAAANAVLFGAPTAAPTPAALWGAGAMLVVGAGTGLWQQHTARSARWSHHA